MRHTRKNAPRRRKHRAIPFILGGNNKREELFWKLLDDPDPRLRVYVYPFAEARRNGAAGFVGRPFEGLVEHLRDEFGTASYVMIRRGKPMELAGTIAIEAPLNWRKRT
jgi:hypothetical protein